MKNLSGSKLQILRECGWAFRDDVSYSEPSRGTGASRGIDIHEAIDKDTLEGVAFDDLTAVERGRSYLRELRAAGWTVETEVALAFDAVSGECRRLPESSHRDYSQATATEIPFTVDYIASAGIMREVGDWKTGYGAHVTRTKENWQVGIAAIALAGWQVGIAAIALAGNMERVRARIHYLDSGYVDAYDFTDFELSVLSREIRQAVARIPGAQPSPGDHCRYCPGRLGCPAVQGAIVAIQPQLATQVRWTLARESLENDALMAMHLPALKAAVEAIEKALKERCKDGLPLPNGKVWRPVLQTRTGLDTERVKALLGPRAPEFIKTTEFEVYRQVKP